MKAKLLHYLGHRERVKKKYEGGGLNSWLDYEILELALFYTIARKDTKPIAKELISKFKTISGVLDADIKELESVKGISNHTALFIKFLKDISRIYLQYSVHGKDLVSSPKAAVDYMKVLLKGSADEEFYALF